MTHNTEGSDNPLAGIQGFDKELLDAVKAGFQPLFITQPTTTIYTVPRTICNVAPDKYKVLYTTFSVDNDFDKVYPKESLNDLHMAAHVHSILSRNPDKTYEDYIAAMNVFSERIKKCHLINIEVDFKRLVALVYSACHIVDNFLLYYEGRLTMDADEICASGLQDLWIDMLLVENQVPFFALQQVFDMTVVEKTKYPSLVELCLHFFSQFVCINKQTPFLESDSVHHLLHLVHYHMLPPKNPVKPQTQGPFSKLGRFFMSHPLTESPEKDQTLSVTTIPSARRLLDAGIMFRTNEEKGFFNITFQQGALEVPYLLVDNSTEALLRNLIAWEQCHLTAGGYFTSYAIFMDYLINTARDVEILNKNGILEHAVVSDEEVASIFNGLSTNVTYIGGEDDFLPQLCKDLNEYCQRRYNNIWWQVVLPVVGAIFFLSLTKTLIRAYTGK